MPVLNHPFPDSKFDLNASAVAGFLGGEESFSALKGVHFMRGRRWLGWYNSPGSLFIAKKFGTISVSSFWNWLFPGPAEKPAKALELDNFKGPRYIGVFSGTQLAETGHLGHLFAYHCKERVPKRPIPNIQSPHPQENLQGTSITIVSLDKDPSNFSSILDITKENLLPFSFPSVFPILFSTAAAIMCGLYGDWYSFTVIVMGSIANGVTTFLLGSGILRVIGPKSSDKSPQGDGLLFDNSDIIILQGSEKLISRIIRGRYDIHYASTSPEYHRFGIGSFLLLLHSLSQLILVPQGILIGQILFLATLVISWGCVYVASFDHTVLQTDVLLKTLENPVIYKFNAGKWTNAAALAVKYSKAANPISVIQDLIPNRTPAWDFWRECVAGAAREERLPSEYAQSMRNPSMKDLKVEDQKFVVEFLGSADQAFRDAEDIKTLIQKQAPKPHITVNTDETVATIQG